MGKGKKFAYRVYDSVRIKARTEMRELISKIVVKTCTFNRSLKGAMCKFLFGPIVHEIFCSDDIFRL